MKKKRLFTPGPTEVPPKTLLDTAKPVIHHRKQDFKNLLKDATGKLKKVLGTDGEIFTFASSGTGAMEAAVVNFTSPGDKALVIDAGKFGHRWKELCETFDVQTVDLNYSWGEAANPEDVGKILKKNEDIKVVFATLVETSSGTVHPVEEIASAVKKAGKSIVVDAVSGLGCDVLKTDKWNVDAVVSGSQKALMTPPGLGFVCVNSDSLELYRKNKRENYYWDFEKASKRLKNYQTPFTPAVNLIRGLNRSLEKLAKEGIENVWERHLILSRGCRAGVKALGLEILSGSPARGLTAVKLPGQDRINSNLIKHMAKNYGIIIAGGQAHMKGEIARIAHMGYYDKTDILNVLAVLGESLKTLGYSCDSAAGLQAASEIFESREKKN
ncbi:MAG: pyridoxal-phosphate-dependent aminotransferase family protein [Elusimicrobiota bacterium]